MTLSTSAVAVCCCSDSRNSLSSRVFSMAMTAWAAKFCHQLDLLVSERSHLLAIDDDGTDEFALFSIGTVSSARAPVSLASVGAACSSARDIGNVDDAFSAGKTTEIVFWTRVVSLARGVARLQTRVVRCETQPLEMRHLHVAIRHRTLLHKAESHSPA